MAKPSFSSAKEIRSARDFDIVKVRKNLLHALALAHIIEEMPDEVEEN